MNWMEQLQKIIGELQQTISPRRRPGYRSTDIVTDTRKTDTTQKTIPRDDIDVINRPPPSLSGTKENFSLATRSKVNSEPSSRTRPNNSETQAIMDKLTRTIDSKKSEH